jgi:two-component system sensor histidine kinase PilS (NtrC family)
MWPARPLAGEDEALRREMRAVIIGRISLITLVTVMAAAFTDRIADLTQSVPLAFLVVLSAGLAVAYHRAARSGAALRSLLAMQLIVDVAVISYLLLFTGGASSPFVPLYLLAPLLGGVFLSARGGMLLAAAAAVAYTVLFAAERGGMLPPASAGMTDRLSDSALRLRLILYVPLFFVVGTVGGALGRTLEEGRRALSEARAELSRALFDTETILENLSSGLATVDAQGIVRHWNRAAGEILGRPVHEIRGRHYEAALGAGFEEFNARLRETLTSGVPGARHEARVHTAGRDVPLGISTSVLHDTEGGRRGVIALFQDLSDVKALEERIRRGETLAAIGELSAGIAHEIRNCLNPIAGSVEVLQRELHVTGQNARLLDLIVRESERLDNFIRELLDYARERPLKTERIDLVELTREIADVARIHPSGGTHKTVSVEAPPNSVWVQVDFEQTKQVLLNLIINALESIEGQGSVTVRVDADETAGPRGRARPDFAMVEVKDTGSGIRAEDLRQVFEPFFSTKLGGTGLGLAIANRIVERHGGTVEIESRVGVGTTLRLRLPKAARPAGAVAHAA